VRAIQPRCWSMNLSRTRQACLPEIIRPRLGELTKATENKIVISIRDEASGCFRFRSEIRHGAGDAIIGALAKQLDAEIQIQARHPGRNSGSSCR